jgi:hypothetical protein
MANTPKEVSYTRITNDVNGNPRYVVHFLELLTQEEKHSSLLTWLGLKYELAVMRAKSAAGRKHDTKSFGGGVVFQSYSGVSHEVAKAFEIFENSKDYHNAENNIRLVVFNSFNEYSKVMDAMKQLLQTKEERDYRVTWSKIYDVCDGVAKDLRQKFNIRMTEKAIWLGAVMVAIEAEACVNESIKGD